MGGAKSRETVDDNEDGFERGVSDEGSITSLMVCCSPWRKKMTCRVLVLLRRLSAYC